MKRRGFLQKAPAPQKPYMDFKKDARLSPCVLFLLITENRFHFFDLALSKYSLF